MKIDRIIGTLLFLLGILFLIDPKSRIFKVNELIFLVILLITFFNIVFYKKKISKKILIVLFFYSILPLIYGVFITEAFEFSVSDYYLKQSIIKSLFIFIIIPLSFFDKKVLKEEMMKILKLYTNFLFLVFLIFFIQLNFSDLLAKRMYHFFKDYEILLLHSKEILSLKIPNIFSGNLLFLLLLLSDLIFNKSILEVENLKYIIFILVLLFLNGTAAIALSALLVCMYYVYTKVSKKITSRLQLVIGILGGVSLLCIFYEKIFYSGDIGNTIKFGHMISYKKMWEENLKVFLFGTGIGTGFYSEGINRISYMTELSYFEIIRIYGLFIGLIILFIIFYPVINLSKRKEETWIMISYLAIFFCGNTNPYLVGVMGTFFISYIYSYIK